ncbi:hypothetical protein ACAW74_11245 [Fibrella sp. WM1]|uniref:hypothetical protein n=1 Tax=Fibrella musci TaxID=3242485 RepID=UPI003521CDC7
MKANDKFITARVHYQTTNQRGFYKPVKEGLRCSLWLDESNFTAAEWRSMSKPVLLPGEICDVAMLTINSKIWEHVKVGDKMFWGVPYESIGELEILGLDTLEFIPTS